MKAGWQQGWKNLGFLEKKVFRYLSFLGFIFFCTQIVHKCDLAQNSDPGRTSYT